MKAKEFVDARTLAEALVVLEERGSEATPLAGGTDLMVQYLRGDISPSLLLHVRRISELRRIQGGERTKLGALTTHWELMNDPHVRCHHPALAEAAATVGGRQTQNVGTIAGNVVNASPAADLLPPLLASGAEVCLQSKRGARTMALSDFLVARRQTARQPDELVTGITLEPRPPGSSEVYLKVGRRGAMEVAIVGLAARFTFDGQTVAEARLAVCSAAPTPFRATEAEAALVGSGAGDDALEDAAMLLARQAAPIDDVRATADYRRRVLARLLRRAAAICRDRADTQL